jgi:hypothetical protein
MWQAGFSKYGATQSKYRYMLDVAPDMRIQLSAITSNFNPYPANVENIVSS